MLLGDKYFLPVLRCLASWPCLAFVTGRANFFRSHTGYQVLSKFTLELGEYFKTLSLSPSSAAWITPNSVGERGQPRERFGGHGGLGLWLPGLRGFYPPDALMAVSMWEWEKEGGRKPWILPEYSCETWVSYSPLGLAFSKHLGALRWHIPYLHPQQGNVAGSNVIECQIDPFLKSWASEPFLEGDKESSLPSNNSFVWTVQGGTGRWKFYTPGLGYLLIGFHCLHDESQWFSLYR